MNLHHVARAGFKKHTSTLQISNFAKFCQSKALRFLKQKYILRHRRENACAKAATKIHTFVVAFLGASPGRPQYILKMPRYYIIPNIVIQTIRMG